MHIIIQSAAEEVDQPVMSLIDRYIIVKLLKGWLLVLAILSALIGILALVEELERVREHYTVINALQFIALSMPQRVLDLAPVITLLGTLLALAGLARHSELIAIRAAGISLNRLLRAAALPACLLIITLELTAEYVTAPLYQQAELVRGAIRSGNNDLLNGKGLWTSKGRQFINIRELHPEKLMLGVDLYEFDADRKLLLAIHAARANINDDGSWKLLEVSYKQRIDDRLVSNHWQSLDIDAWLSPQELSLLSLSQASMPLSVLYQYTQYLNATGQPAERFALLFWQKVATPFAAAAMVFLAVPLGAGPGTQRSSSFGLRIALGAITGIVFYLLTQIIYATGLLLKLDAFVIALIPIFIILAASAVLLPRMR
jgi:lipopolysaccharide export system permease protein